MPGTFIDIVILNFNQEKDTVECISSLKEAAYTDYRIILVDNGSADGSGQRIKERFKDIEFLSSAQNLGFTGGCNLGINHSLKSGRAGFILLLNNDTRVSGNLFEELSAVMRTDASIGIAGAVNYYYSRPDEINMSGHRFLWYLGIQRVAGGFEERSKEMQSVSGCCMLVRKEVFEKAGLLDDRYFIYYEDADLCMRARRFGYKVVAVRDAKVWHKISTTFGLKTPGEYYIYTRNQPLFMLKNCPRIFLPDYFLVYFLKISLRIVYFSIVARRDLVLALCHGLEDFIKGRYGKGRLFG